MGSNKKATAAQDPSSGQSNGISGEGLAPDLFIAAKKNEAVEKVMAVFMNWLDKRLAIITYAYESSAGCSGSFDSNEPADAGADKTSRSGRGKRQFNEDEDNASSSGGGRDEDRGPGGSKRAKKDGADGPRFACPFFQHEPARHVHRRSCAGPGWDDIHRLKEHLYRCHMSPEFVCPRCGESMRDNQDLDDHIRSDIPCAKKNFRRHEGIDKTKRDQLKSRKRISTTCSIAEKEAKWREIYMICYPGANKSALPSPYYDVDQSAALIAQHTARWKKMEKRIRKELPEAVRKTIEHRFEDASAEMIANIPDVVRSELRFLLDNLSKDQSLESVSSTPDSTPRSATPQASNASEANAACININTYLSDANGPNMMLGFCDESLVSDYCGDFDFDFPAAGSDSGYASTGTARDGFAHEL